MVEAVRAGFLCEDMQNSRGGITGLGDTTTNLSPPVKGHFLHYSFPKKHTPQAEELASAGRGKVAPAGLAFWYLLPAWRKICHLDSTLHGGPLVYFQAKGKITE